MNRRAKVIATVSTLFLSLVILVTSVYASVSVSFTIGGTVAYELKDVLVDVDTNFYYSTDNTVLKGDAIATKANLVAGETLPTDLVSVEGFTTRSVSTYKNGQVVELTDEEKTISGLQVKFGKYDSESEEKKSYSYYLVMEVTNHGENPVAVNVVDNTTAENVERLATTAINFINNGEKLEKDQTKKLVIAFNLTDLTQSITTADFSFAVTIAEVIPVPDLTMSYVNKQDETITASRDYANTVVFDQLNAKTDYYSIYEIGYIYNVTLSNIPQDVTQLYVDLGGLNFCGLYSHQESFSQAYNIIGEIFNTNDEDYINSNTFQFIIDLTKQENGTLNLCIVAMVDSLVEYSSTSIIFSFELSPLLFYNYNVEDKTCYVRTNRAYFLINTDDLSIEIPKTIEFDGEEYTVTGVGFWAFSGCDQITNITIPDSVEIIDDYAFSGANNITNIEIPDSVKIIGNSAFADCEKLSSVKLGNGVEEIRKDAFIQCYDLVSVTMGNNVKTIGECAFQNDALIENMIIPDSVTTIGFGAFRNCRALNISLGDNIEKIGYQAFASINQSNITMEESGLWYLTSRGGSKYLIDLGSQPSEEFILPSDIQVVQDGVLGYTSFTNITVDENNPRYTSKIGGVETNCIIEVAEDNSYYRVVTGNCNSILVEGMTEIGDHAFSWCKNLSGELIIPDSVTLIGNYAFEYCSNITSVDLGNVQVIGREAFDNCCNITNFVVSNSITTIKDSAFSCCESVTSITIPDTVTYIGYGAFYLWTDEQSIYFIGTMPERFNCYWQYECEAKIYLNGELYTGE